MSCLSVWVEKVNTAKARYRHRNSFFIYIYKEKKKTQFHRKYIFSVSLKSEIYKS